MVQREAQVKAEDEKAGVGVIGTRVAVSETGPGGGEVLVEVVAAEGKDNA